MKYLILLLALSASLIAVQAAPGNDSLPIGHTTPLPVPAFDPEAATQQYVESLPAKDRERSNAYFEGGYWLILWAFLYGAVGAWIFLFGGLSAWIKRKTSRFRSVNIRNLFYAILYLPIVFLLSLPLDIYQNFIREHQYGLSNQNFGQWLGDDLKSLAVNLILGSLALVILYMVGRKAGKRWWVWGAMLSIFFLIIGAIIAPVFISPLFNKYKPLDESPLKAQILSMARANQVPADNVYQFDASLQSKRISANVSGFAGTTRISLNDNLLNRCSPAEIKAVMGHEMGHYVLNHIYKSIIEFGLVIFLGFAFVAWAAEKLLKRYGARWKVESVTDIAGLPLIIFLFSFYMFLATPVTNTITRTQEIEADQFGLNAAREPDGFASTAMKLSEYRKIAPGYWEELFFFDHPSGRRRVHAAMVWKAEQK